MLQGPYTKEGVAFKDANPGKTAPALPENEFVLSGIVVHSGQANGGHYYSFVRQWQEESKTYRWLKFDDAEVREGFAYLELCSVYCRSAKLILKMTRCWHLSASVATTRSTRGSRTASKRLSPVPPSRLV